MTLSFTMQDLGRGERGVSQRIIWTTRKSVNLAEAANLFIGTLRLNSIGILFVLPSTKVCRQNVHHSNEYSATDTSHVLGALT